MSATTVCTKDVLQKPRRTRKTHAKVKTGCATCKIRRKKCDETRPHCIRCTSTGRTCDGYSYPSPATTTASTPSPLQSDTVLDLDRSSCATIDALLAISPSSNPSCDLVQSPATILRSPCNIVFSSDTDYYCFDYFRFNTGLQLQNYYNSSLWQNGAVKAAVLYPVVLKVAMAVGAVHQRYNHGISRKAFEYCAVADRLHRDALQALQVFLKEDRCDPNFNDVSMISSLLLSLYEGFQGNFSSAAQYYGSGLKAFWSRPVTVTQSDCRYRSYKMGPSLFFGLLEQYSKHVVNHYGSLPNYLAHRASGASLPRVPSFFNSLAEARDFIFTEFQWLLHTPARLWRRDLERTQALNFHTTRILRWSAAYAELQRSQPFSTRIQRRAGRLLKHVRDAIYLLLFIIFFVRPNNSDTDLANITFPEASADWDSVQATLTNSDDDNSDSDHLFECDTEPESLYINLPIVWDLIQHLPNVSTNLSRLCMLAETSFEATSPFTYDSHSISVDSSIGQPPTKTPTPANSSKTRHILRNLLRRTSPSSAPETFDGDTNSDTNKDGAWTDLGVYRVAEMLSSMEEHALPAAVQALLPDVKDWKWIDISCFIEERRLLVQYCRPDGLGERSRGLLWVQQWLEW